MRASSQPGGFLPESRSPLTIVSGFGSRTPAERTAPPRLVARVCLNGHVVESDLTPEVAGRAATNRADPLAVDTTPVRCPVCRAGTIVGCACCGYPIPGHPRDSDRAVPHFRIVCGEYYPWTFRGEFYTTLEEILEESGVEHGTLQPSLDILARQREGLASSAEVRDLVETFRALGGSDWDLAAQILAVVLPAGVRRDLDLRAAFVH